MTDPAYGRASLADLLPSVLASLGVAGEASPLALAPPRRAVVLLVDGLGLELLERHAEVAPFLSSLAGRTLTTGFPSTTVTSLSSFGTGLPPGEHGLTGYTSWAQEVEQVVGWLSWAPAGGGGDLRGELVPEDVQPQATAFERAAQDGIEVTIAAPAHFEGSGLTRAVLRGGHYRGAVTAADAIAHAVAGSRLGDRSLVYCYTPALDTTGHVRGVDSEAWRIALTLVDRYAEELAARLPRGTVLHVTADHGMVDVGEDDKLDLDARPDLMAGVRAVAGEPRARHVHAVPGAKRDVLDAWRATLGDVVQVLSRAQAVEAGLLGPVVTPQALRRTGDVVAVSTGALSLVQRERDPFFAALVGQHGAMTPAEVLVPLLTT
ncbi:MAG: alkaline phosphatase family protein [Frankiaceae bacterium]|nr:alkaline phosphatase family protein [Frankiaceae bacterium]